MSGLSSIALVTVQGVLVIYRQYRDDASRASLQLFQAKITTRTKDVNSLPPVCLIDGTTFAFVRRRNIYAVATTCRNFNPTLALQFLYQFLELLAVYLGPKFGENEIRNKFTLVYELLDETIDYGIPQNCSPEVLKLYVLASGELPKSKGIQTPSQLTDQITGKTDWRREGIVYRNNEIYLDFLESINVLIGSDGTVLRCDVQGEIKVRCYLSGMPECKLMVNDRLFLENKEKELERGLPSDDDILGTKSGRPRHQPMKKVNIDDLSFHRCVRLGKFDTDRSVVFVPPDGVFELARYRVSEDIKLPFRVVIVADQTKRRVMYNVRITSTYPKEVVATNIIVKIPCPPNTARVSVYPSTGRAKYEPGEQAIVWRMRFIAGGTELLINAIAELAPQVNNKPWSRPPLTMMFKLSTFTASGIYVHKLRVLEASNYVANKYVRYITKAGSYQVRF